MNKSLNWELLAKYLSNECTSHEKNDIETWMYADPENQQLVEILKISWNTTESAIQTSDTNQQWWQLAENAGLDSTASERVNIPFNKTDSVSKRWPFLSQLPQSPIWRYAAVFLIFLLSALYFISDDLTSLLRIDGQTELKTISVGHGQRERIILSDGSEIILDAGTKLTYPDKFIGNSREVYLSGEAFFEIITNPAKPFIVYANQAAIEVVGTKFNIRAWQQELKMTVTVSEGKVLLHPEIRKNEKSVSLIEGHASTLPLNGQPTLPRLVDVAKSTGWMKNEIFFENASF